MFRFDTILFFILTLLLMGFFAGIEMAFYSANRLSLELKKKQSGASHQILSRFVASPAIFLGMTLIGFTIFLVLFALQIENVMAPVWSYFKVKSAALILTSEIILATLLVLIFAEFIPRAYFRANSNKLLGRLAYISNFFFQIFHVIAVVFIDLSEWLLKYLFNVRVDKNKVPLNRSDLKHLFRQTADEDRQERNTQLLENAQELPKVKIRQCLVPRNEIIGIDSSATINEVKNKFIIG